MVLFLAACGLFSRPTPTLPETQLAPLPIHWSTGAADMFIGIHRSPPDGAVDGVIWWHGPDGEKPPGATDRLGPPIGVATLLRENYADWNILEVDRTSLRMGGDTRPIQMADGRIPADDKRGELISALDETLLTRVEGGLEFEARTNLDLPPWRVGLRVAPDVPWATMQEVIFTAAQARYAEPCFVGGGTYEAMEQRCFRLETLAMPGRPAAAPDAQVVVSSEGARVDGEASGPLDEDASALQGAELVLLRVQDSDVPAGKVAHWIGVLARAGVDVHLRIRTDAEVAGEEDAR